MSNLSDTSATPLLSYKALSDEVVVLRIMLSNREDDLLSACTQLIEFQTDVKAVLHAKNHDDSTKVGLLAQMLGEQL